MATIQEVIEQLKPKVKGFRHFKIGKTGQSVKERFDSEHSQIYTHIEELVYSTNASIIDAFEIGIIKHFKTYSNNDNIQDGGGEMTPSKRYIVYIVWN